MGNNSSSAIIIATIIVLVSMVAFSGMSTPSSANFAKYCQEVDNVSMAVLNNYAKLLEMHAISGDKRTAEQIYIEVATGKDPGQYAVMHTKTVQTGNGKYDASASTGCQNIEIGPENMTLPAVREQDDGWYLTKEGTVFNATGFIYDDKTYWSAYYYTKGKLDGTASIERAETIAKSILNNMPNEIADVK